MKTKITMLVENTAGRRGLLAEHGLAVWIEIGGFRLLFDTGQGLALRHNSEVLAIEPWKADAIALSHGHYDHTGALAQLLAHTPSGLPLYLHADAAAQRWAVAASGQSREVGMPEVCRMALSRRESDIVSTNSMTEIGSGLFLTGEVPRETDFEMPSDKFYFDAAGITPDPIMDDQALFFESEGGIVVVCGCAHSGVINTLRYVCKLCSTTTILGVIGGMHLTGQDLERSKRTVEALKEFEVQWLAPGHCTGFRQRAAMWNAFPESCVECSAGSVFEFPS